MILYAHSSQVIILRYPYSVFSVRYTTYKNFITIQFVIRRIKGERAFRPPAIPTIVLNLVVNQSVWCTLSVHTRNYKIYSRYTIDSVQDSLYMCEAFKSRSTWVWRPTVIGIEEVDNRLRGLFSCSVYYSADNEKIFEKFMVVNFFKFNINCSLLYKTARRTIPTFWTEKKFIDWWIFREKIELRILLSCYSKIGHTISHRFKKYHKKGHIIWRILGLYWNNL